MPSPQKCPMIHTDWETLSVAGQACPAGLEVNSVVSEVRVTAYVYVDIDMYVSALRLLGGGGGGGGGGGDGAGKLKPMGKDSANRMSTNHPIKNA